MNDTIVRIVSLEIENIKNTHYGLIEMPGSPEKKLFHNHSEILGIYGQNGSGKTAVVDTFYFLQKIMMGSSIPEDMINYINKENDYAKIHVEFTIQQKELKFEVGYFVELHRTESGELRIERESLNSAKITLDKRSNKLPFMEYELNDSEIVFTPKKRFDEVITNDKENKMNLLFAKKMAKMRNCSFIFGEASREIFLKQYENSFADYAFIITTLYNNSIMNLFVIRNTHSGAISANFMLPMAFSIGDKKSTTKGDFVVALREPTVLDENRFSLLQRIVSEINVVIGAIIPGLSIDIQDYGQQMLENGEIGRRIELISQREDIRIPIRYESEGIIKIISILDVLIRSYNDPSICLVVDELDAGIYEYLLGEILDIYNNGGRGQLIFTSHNLRPLEMLNNNSILFSTTNPNNRYIRMQSIKNNNNLRDVYLRSITLGGQKEDIYSETDSIKIARAFRNAGREILNAK